MKRDEALALVKARVKNKNIVKHCLAVEAVMRALARKLSEDEEKWGLTGLLHDADYDETTDTPEKQGQKIADELREKGLEPEFCEAIAAHNEATGVPAKTVIAKALKAADPVTGLIVAATLVLPSKKIKDLKPESVGKRYKEKSFAKGASREAMLLAEEIGLKLSEFFDIAYTAMSEISEDLGL